MNKPICFYGNKYDYKCDTQNCNGLVVEINHYLSLPRGILVSEELLRLDTLLANTIAFRLY